MGVICLALGVLCVASLAIGWIRAGGDPSFVFSTRRGDMPIWVLSIWIGSFGTLLLWLGVSVLRDASLYRAGDGDPERSRSQEGGGE